MASSLLVRAKQFMERNKARSVRLAREHTKTTALVVGGLAGTGTAVAAALADQKMGAGNQWKVGPVPAVAIGGAALLVPAFFTNKMPIVQAGLVSAGMTAINIELYRYLVEEGIDPGEPSG